MTVNFTRNDAPRCVAALKVFLNAYELTVVNIDDRNSGNDCLYHSILMSLGTQSRPTPDRLSQQIDGVAQPEKGIKEMSTLELRQAAANTLRWLWDTTEDAYLEMRDSLHVHVNTESRDHMQAAGRIAEGADLATGYNSALHCTDLRHAA